MSNKKKNILILIILLTLTISIYLVYKVVDTLRYRGGRPNDVLYIDSVASDIGYTVYLKPNTFFDIPYVDNSFSYVTSLVQYIKTTFVYDYVGSADVSANYDYYIEGKMTSNYINTDVSQLTKPLWVKTFTLLDHKRGSAKSSKINVREDLNIGIDYYNSLLDSFSQNTNILLDSKLDVTLIMNITGQLANGKEMYKTHQMTMSIPLGVKAFDITTAQNFPEHEVIYSKEQKKAETSYMLTILYITIIIALLWIEIYFIRLIINKDKNKYEEKVLKILKDYDDRIVTVSNFVRYESMDIVEIPDFEELLTLSNETMEPIIYWEKRNRDSKEAWFSIIKDKILYRYVISYKK
jgi:hypothetical protein